MIGAFGQLLQARAVDVDLPDVPPWVVGAAEAGLASGFQFGRGVFGLSVVSLVAVEAPREDDTLGVPGDFAVRDIALGEAGQRRDGSIVCRIFLPNIEIGAKAIGRSGVRGGVGLSPTIDLEIIGHVVSSHFTDHYTKEVLPEVAQRVDIFDMALGAVVYKLAESRYVEIIKEAHNGNAADDALSTSWEIGFNEFKIGVGGKNLEDCEIITDPEQIEKMKPLLKAFGGTGETEDGIRVRRIITGKALGLGGGFTFSPAADVKGVYIEKAPQEDVEEEEEDYAEYEHDEECIFDDHEKVISSDDEFTREELIDTLGDLLKEWKDKEHPYYKDLMLFMEDITVEEEAVATYDFEEMLASLAKILKNNLKE